MVLMVDGAWCLNAATFLPHVNMIPECVAVKTSELGIMHL